MTTASAQDEPLEPGRVLGGAFRIDEPFSRGTFGSVYKAVRLEDGLEVVAKALREDAGRADPSAVDRFIREAAVAAMLDHPNVVRTLNFGKTRDNVLYIILERLHGATLIEAMYDHRTPPDVTREVVRQMLAGLDYAHGLGIVHRDIKPSNVFVCNPEHRSAYGQLEGDMVKLLDFGFVKVLDPPNEILAKSLTLAGHVVGTPGYIAPELMAPDEKPIVTPAADLYSTGIIGYELLTGQKAFTGEGIQRALKQLKEEPQPPPDDLADEPLLRVLRKLFVRSLDGRYQSAREALEDLESLPQ